MKAIFFKELNAFYSSLVGFITVCLFIIIMGLLLWVIPSFSILEFGYATLESFFDLCPIVLMIIIPAITMKLYSEEYQSGTIEWLYTKPVSNVSILLAKYFSSVVVMIIALVPTIVYYFSVYYLGFPEGNVDTGGVIGSYIGLVFLIMVFCAIGICCSSFSQNQIVAFIVSIVLCGSFYWGFDFISEFFKNHATIEFIIQYMGIKSHYRSISRGIVDTRDLVYFISLILLLLYSTLNIVEKKKI